MNLLTKMKKFKQKDNNLQKSYQSLQQDRIPNAELILEMTKRDSFYDAIKRMSDIVISLFIILITLPVKIIIICAIKLDSPGPVIFKQTRTGQNRRLGYRVNGQNPERRNGHNLKGKPIEIYKFRTMRADTNAYAVSPENKNDPRITRVGRIIRPLCLDELPQLFNVIKGDLSLVGPRPEMSFIVKNYEALEVQRLLVKPGITGIWQLKGSRHEPIHKNLDFDLEYIRKRSIIFDLKILMKTLGFIFSSKNT